MTWGTGDAARCSTGAAVKGGADRRSRRERDRERKTPREKPEDEEDEEEQVPQRLKAVFNKRLSSVDLTRGNFSKHPEELKGRCDPRAALIEHFLFQALTEDLRTNVSYGSLSSGAF